MSKPEIHVIHHPELNSSITPITEIRPYFKKVQSSIEAAITLTRRMTPTQDEGDWGSWFYHRGFGKGALHIPFAETGIARVSVHCGGDIGDDDISRSRFEYAIGFWKSPRFAYAVLALNEHRYIRDVSREPEHRRFFFYQEARGLLRLEEFGSVETGWYSIEANDVPRAIVSFDFQDVPIQMDPVLLQHDLEYKKETGSFGDLRLYMFSR